MSIDSFCDGITYPPPPAGGACPGDGRLRRPIAPQASHVHRVVYAGRAVHLPRAAPPALARPGAVGGAGAALVCPVLPLEYRPWPWGIDLLDIKLPW
jgi:hypothetical protein